MDIYFFEKELKTLSVDDVAATFKLLLAWDDTEASHGRGERLASCLAGQLQAWDKHGDFLGTFL